MKFWEIVKHYFRAIEKKNKSPAEHNEINF